MTERSMLHLSKVDEFADWLRARGWTIEPLRDYYDVICANHRKHAPFSLTRYANSDYAVVPQSSTASALVDEFIQDRRKQRHGLATRRDRAG